MWTHGVNGAKRSRLRWRLLFAWLGAGLLSSTGAWAAESSGFALETGSPDALCPELEMTRELVARRLGSLVVEGHKGWRARYTIGHAPSGNPRDFVRLELFSPEGGAELVRDLPIEGDSCRTMAEVIALVLDRYFRGLGADEQRPAEPADSPAAREQPAVTRALPRDARAQRVDLMGNSPRLSAEYAVTLPLSQPWLGLRVSGALRSNLEAALALRAGLTPLQESAPRGASVEARAVAARGSVSWRLSLPPGLLHLGPAVSLAVEQATTHGLARQTDRTRVLWVAGVDAGFLAPLGRSLFVEAGISLSVLLRSGQFFVDEREVLTPRALTLGWSLGFGYAWGR
jgi:hypothetical protein